MSLTAGKIGRAKVLMHAEQGHEKVLPLRNTRSLFFPFAVPSLNWSGYLSSDTSEYQVIA